MRPMSWYGGSQMTPALPSCIRKAPWMRWRLCSRLPWLSITPLGVPVEPEVYWRKASESPRSSGRFQPASAPWGSSSVATQRRPRSSGADSKSISAMEVMKDGASTTEAWASRMRASRRGRVRSRRVGSGG